jgi:hypothetical protein
MSRNINLTYFDNARLRAGSYIGAMNKTSDLIAKLNASHEFNLVGETFRHYKGGIYTVDDLVIDTDDGSVRVLYFRVDGPDFDFDAELGIRFVRPIGEFLGKNEEGKPRFQRVRRVETWVDSEVDSE